MANNSRYVFVFGMMLINMNYYRMPKILIHLLGLTLNNTFSSSRFILQKFQHCCFAKGFQNYIILLRSWILLFVLARLFTSLRNGSIQQIIIWLLSPMMLTIYLIQLWFNFLILNLFAIHCMTYVILCTKDLYFQVYLVLL